MFLLLGRSDVRNRFCIIFSFVSYYRHIEILHPASGWMRIVQPGPGQTQTHSPFHKPTAVCITVTLVCNSKLYVEREENISIFLSPRMQ